MDKLIDAIHFAAIAHSNQRRKNKSTTPYINHPIEVMQILSKATITDIDTLCAAVLHDTIEDTDVTYDQIVDQFGINVANIVKEVTDDKSLPKVIRKQEQIKHAKIISVEAKLVKAADKISNLSSLLSDPPTCWTPTQIDGYFTWCYAVWLGLLGNNRYLDEQLQDLFKTQLTLTDEELEHELTTYYNSL